MRSNEFAHTNHLTCYPVIREASPRFRSIAAVLTRMRTSRYLFALLLVSPCLCQTVHRDQAALTLIASATVAVGGPSASALTNVVATGQSLESGESRTLVWSETASEYSYSYGASGGGGGTDVETGSQDHYSQNHGGNTTASPPLLIRGHFSLIFPTFKLLALASDSTSSLTYKGSVTLDGKSYVAIHSTEGSTGLLKLLTGKTWYFDPSTGLLAAVDYYVPEQRILTAGVHLRAVFSDYRAVSGVMFPYDIKIDTSDKQLPMEYTFTSVTVNSALPSVASSTK
jgi:hypothetical protein